MSADEVDEGQTIEQDSSEEVVRIFNWDDALAVGATIYGAPVFTVTKLEPVLGSAVTTVDSVSVLSDGRSVQFRTVSGGAAALGHLYEIECKIVTTETPAQTATSRINVRINQR